MSKMLRDLGVRVYSNKMIVEKNAEGVEINKDEMEIKEIVNKTFGKGSPSPENLHLFNQFLVETAEEIAKPKVQEILGYIANFSTVPAGAVKVVEMPKTVEPKFSYTAKGTGVDLERIDGSVTRKILTPESITYGAYYEITTFMADPITAFNNAVNGLVQAKIDLYFEKVMTVLKEAVKNAEVPESNCVSGSNLTLIDYKKVENTMIRLGGRPILVGDISLIQHFADQVPESQKDLLTDELRQMLREDLVPSKFGKTIAIPFDNRFIDESNSQVRFDVKTGFIFPGAAPNKKPIEVAEFGVKRQYSTIDPETERVMLKIVLEEAVCLTNGRYIGLVEDKSITV